MFSFGDQERRETVPMDTSRSIKSSYRIAGPVYNIRIEQHGSWPSIGIALAPIPLNEPYFILSLDTLLLGVEVDTLGVERNNIALLVRHGSLAHIGHQALGLTLHNFESYVKKRSPLAS